jgi:hypothetical protein
VSCFYTKYLIACQTSQVGRITMVLFAARGTVLGHSFPVWLAHVSLVPASRPVVVGLFHVNFKHFFRHAPGESSSGMNHSSVNGNLVYLVG